MLSRRFSLLLCFSLGFSLVAASQSAKKPAPDVIKRADAAFHEGFAARQAGNLELARTKFAEVVRLQPAIAEGHEALGAVLVELGKPLDGALEFEAAAKIKPADDQIETNLGLAYAQAGEPQKAIPHFEAALSLSQQSGHAATDASVYDAYGHALASAGKPDAAALQFVAEEAITGPRADLEDAIGTLYAQQKEWQEAEQRFRACHLPRQFLYARSPPLRLALPRAKKSGPGPEHALRSRRHESPERRGPDGIRPHSRLRRQR